MRRGHGGVQQHQIPERLDKPAGLSLCGGMRELLRTNDPTIIPYATTLLQGEGIECFELDVHMSGLGIVPRRLMVREADLFMARAILREAGVPLES